MNYQAALILRERLHRSCSQQDLCRGICAVSYPLMLVNRGLCGFLGSNSAILRSAAVQRYIPENLRARANALDGVMITAGSAVFSLLIGLLGEVMDFRLCLTMGGGIALLASWLLIHGRRRDARLVYERADAGAKVG